MKLVKHLSLFSGLGGASSALRQAGVPYTTLAISETAPKALAMYQAIHGHVPTNEGDIVAFSKNTNKLRFYVINEKPHLITGGFPCQPFSRLNQKEIDWETDERWLATLALRDVVNVIRPPYVLLENVAAIMDVNHRDQVIAWLDGFRGYDYIVDFANPINYGYHQSRGRNYILMSRKGVKPWLPGKMVKRKRKFKFDVSPHPSQFYYIGSHRVKRFVSKSDPKFACLAARSCDAHCSRFTWIPIGTRYRTPTPNELFQLFGYKKYPKLTLKQHGGISRASIFYPFGNSWHIAHAASHMKTLPLP